VSLAETDTAIDEERVVLFAGLICDRMRGGMCELIGRADHEFRESVARVQTRMAISPRGDRSRAIRRRRLAVAVSIRMPVAVAVAVAIAICMTIAWALQRRRDARILAERQLHLDLPARLLRQRGAHE